MTNANAPTEVIAKSAETPPPAKPGFKTSEFWLTSLATVMGLVLASGAVTEGGMVSQIIGGVLALLANLGYTASRTQVKKP